MNRSLVIAAVLLTALYFFLKKPAEKPATPPPAIDVINEVGSVQSETSPTQTPKSSEARATPGAARAALAQPVAPAPSPVGPGARSSAERARPPKPPPGGVAYKKRGENLVVFGDVLYGKPQDPSAPETGFVRVNPVELWDENPIPYFIDPALPNPERVQKAINFMNERTPVHFVPYSGQPNAIVFQKGDKDCISYLGRIGGHQPIKLDNDCNVADILHEMLHALGFVHEQSRPDRDQFVQINWDQIEPENRSQFEVAPDEVTKFSMTAPFDYQSVMMYRPNSFVISPGMIAIQSKTATPVQPVENGLSAGDLDRVYKLYGR